MFFQNVYEKGLAQASYVIGCQATGTAIVVDPKRDIDTYLEIAAKERLKITHVTETHIHADFLSGSRELAVATGAELLLSDEGGPDWQYQFPHRGLKDGEVFKVGNIKFEVMHSPGHTPEHISFLVTDLPSGDAPLMILSGDFVFVGDVGRPDLLEKAAGLKGTQETGARQMYVSLKRFKALPDYVQVWPGHGAGSACGKALGAVPSSTVGYSKLTNWALRYEDENAFVQALLEGQPEPPKYFAMMKKLNKIARPVLDKLPEPRELSVNEIEHALQQGITLIDARKKTDFAQGHIPGSLLIQDNSAFSTWAGWLLDYEKPFMLVAPKHRIAALTRALLRIGLDNLFGYTPDLNAWRSANKPLGSIKDITAAELAQVITNKDVELLDVRATSEYQTGHIAGARHLHLGYLPDNLDTIPRHKTLVLQCAAGDRSGTACSLLAKHGFKNILNLTGGISAWMKSGLPVEK
ncbi:MBL fold metallo-hydrolase [candidate division KSB1 bacterium]|nr:MBL fold metallo-hydrolase [candidate division KSB1 bacterium]